MIQKIEIHNFRCFEETKISGFKRVNLIGGKNNCGKTALLEAIYVGNFPSPDSIKMLRIFRKESEEFLKALPEEAWNNFFFNIEKNVKIFSECDTNAYLSINKFELTEDFREFKISNLIAHWNIDNNKGSYSLKASPKGIEYNDEHSKSLPININFIPSANRASISELAIEFEKADYYGNADSILKAMQLIEPTIDGIKTFKIGELILYLNRGKDKRLPISLFGEAIIKITAIILNIINNKNSILLIDEIENGIHYTNQFEFWKMLFKLAKEFDIQIFATTHSGEMIRAFTNAGLEESEAGNDDIAAYVELARNIRTGRIAGIIRDVEQLDYELKHNMGVRGE
jgi:AAA15 family ATPase/GTPase